MADKSTQLILDALSRAALEPAGAPLHSSKSAGGLFPATALARQAAQRCREEGYVREVVADGRPGQELWAITEKGLEYLLRTASPKDVLEDFVRVLEAREGQMAALLATAEQARAGVEALRRAAHAVLERVLAGRDRDGPPAPHWHGNGHAHGAAGWEPAAAACLAAWRAAGASEDCPLPYLFHQVCLGRPAPTIGEFHDGLRRMHEQGQIYLHPWTGPLYDMPEPALALLVGHEIMYYACPR